MNGMSPFELSFRKSVNHRRMAPIGLKSNSPIKFEDYDQAVTAMLDLVFYLYELGIVYQGVKTTNLIKHEGQIYITNFKEVTFQNIDRNTPKDQLDIESLVACQPVKLEKCLVWSLGKFVLNLYGSYIRIPIKYRYLVNGCLTERQNRLSIKQLKKHYRYLVNTDEKLGNQILINVYGMISQDRCEDHTHFAKLWLEEKVPSGIIIFAIRLYWYYGTLLRKTTERKYIIITLIMYATEMLGLKNKVRIDKICSALDVTKEKSLKLYKDLYMNHFTYLPIHIFQIVIKNELSTLDTISYLISQPQTFTTTSRLIRRKIGLLYFNQDIPDEIYIPSYLIWLVTNPTIYKFVKSYYN
jgi:hypothetical protein